MKKGEVFKVDSAWWQKNKASTLKSDLDLGKHLKAYEDSIRSLRDDPTIAKYRTAIKLLGEIGDTAKTLAGKCNAVAQAETKSTLLTAPAAVAAASTPLSAEAAEHQSKIKKAEIKFPPIAAKVAGFLKDMDRLADLINVLREALSKTSRIAVQSSYAEYEKCYKDVMLVGPELEEVHKEYKDLWDWAKKLSEEDSPKALTAMATIDQGVRRFEMDKKKMFDNYFSAGKALDRHAAANGY